MTANRDARPGEMPEFEAKASEIGGFVTASAVAAPTMAEPTYRPLGEIQSNSIDLRDENGPTGRQD